MISRQQYLHGFEHPDLHVRSGVLCMFAEDGDLGLDVTKAAMAAMDRFGILEAFQYPHKVGDLAIDEAGVAWALEKAVALGEENATGHILDWVCNQAPIAILRKRIAEIEGVAAGKFQGFPELITFARRRIEYHDIPADECLLRLNDVLKRCEEEEEYPHALIDEARQLCRRLVDGDDARAELERLTQEWLSFDFNEEPSFRHWFSGIAIELAGKLGLQSTIPRLIEHFDYDWDWWNESI